MADDTGKKKGLGEDVWEQALHEVMPKVARQFVAALPTALLRSPLAKLVTKGLPILSVAIGRLTPDGGPWEYVDEARVEFMAELREALAERTGGKIATKDPKKGAVTMDPTVVALRNAGGFVYHHPHCTALAGIPRTIGGGGGKGKGGKPNPNYVEMPLSAAKAQNIPAHAGCQALLAATEAKADAPEPRTFLEMLAALTVAQRTEFWRWFEHDLTADKQTYVMRELEVSLGSKTELAMIIETPIAQRIRAVESLKNPVTDVILTTAREIRDGARQAGAMVAPAITQANAAMLQLATQLNTPPQQTNAQFAWGIYRFVFPMILALLVLAGVAIYVAPHIK